MVGFMLLFGGRRDAGCDFSPLVGVSFGSGAFDCGFCFDGKQKMQIRNGKIFLILGGKKLSGRSGESWFRFIRWRG